jgi:hypothetical protein
MRFIRRHFGAQKGDAANLGSLSGPHREQNLSANPKRTAKSSVLTLTQQPALGSNKSQMAETKKLLVKIAGQ